MASSPGTLSPQNSPEKSLEMSDLPPSFRKLIDESEGVFSNVTVIMNREDTEIHIEDQKFLYPFRLTRITPVSNLPKMHALMKLLTDFKIEQFEVKTESAPEVFTEFIDILKSLSLKIRAEEFFYSKNHQDLMILVLEHLDLDELEDVEPIEEMEQRQMEITEHLQLINNYILNCATAKYQVYKCYTMLSKIFGHFKLPYVEFEWKYYQHYHGNSDLSIWKRSEEMCSLSDKMEGFKHVIKQLDIMDRLILRKTSCEMRQLVDGSNFHCDEVELHIWTKNNNCFIGINKWRISYDWKETVFYDDVDGSRITVDVSENVASDSRKRLQRMCDDASLILKNPNLIIKKLHIGTNFCDASNQLIAMIQKLNRPIHVEKVHIQGNLAIITILPILQILYPEILKKIKLDCSIITMKLWREIQETDQWKKAETFKTNRLPNAFPIEDLFHFKKIRCKSAKVGTERLKKIRDIFVTSAHLEYLEIERPTHELASIDKIDRIMSENTTYNPKIGGFLIPNSKDYFHLYLESNDKDYFDDDDDDRTVFGVERVAVKEDSVDSKVENDYPDATEISKFILKAALKKEQVFDSYKEWCQNPENPKIDFLDFEWRYYEFYHGKRDMSIEKSSQNSLTFSDLKNEVLEKIVKETNMLDRLVLRKVCRNLRGIVDKTNANCKEVFLYFGFDEMFFGWENEYIKYLRAEDEDEFGYEVQRVSEYEETKTKELNLSEDELARMMCDDAENFLKTPDQKIGKCAIYLDHDYCKPLLSVVVRFLESLEFKICTEELNLAHNNPFHKILQYFDSNYLKKLCLNDKMKCLEDLEESMARSELEKLTETEHWTKIESFQMDFYLPNNFPIENMFHLKQITIKSMEMTEMRLVKIRDNLLKSAHFESASFSILVSHDDDERARWRLINGVMSQAAEYNSRTHRFSIPNSQDYYHLKFGYGRCSSLSIRRISEN